MPAETRTTEVTIAATTAVTLAATPTARTPATPTATATAAGTEAVIPTTAVTPGTTPRTAAGATVGATATTTAATTTSATTTTATTTATTTSGTTAATPAGVKQLSPSDEDGLQSLSLTPHLHALLLASLTHRRNSNSCCPHLFERAAESWWNPRFDSDILEDEYIRSSLPTLRLRLRYCLAYTIVASCVWLVYWLAAAATPHRYAAAAVAATTALLMLTALFVTTTTYYVRYQKSVSVAVSVVLLSASLLPYTVHHPSLEMCTDLSSPTIMAITFKVLLMVYTLVPLSLHVAVLLCCCYSVLCELLNMMLTDDSSSNLVLVRAALHLITHLIAAHIMLMTQVRMRGTFLSMGQSLLVRRELEREKAVKEAMILSVMPPKVAHWLLHAQDEEGMDESGRRISSPRSSNTAGGGSDLRSMVFRPFNMNCMDHVSILFADIVGFTRMSSNKTAEQLVGLLNDLFGRFDELCTQHGCEKISTLGDCYYAVSGCPTPREDHATCCVNMGLSMITAISQFDADRNENVDMRVGVHTGKVLCGIVGTKCFKFDVWSNDVTLANQLESSGQPGFVHISESTLEFLPTGEDGYVMSPADDVHGYKTYLITKRKRQLPPPCFLQQPPLSAIKAEEHGKKSSSLPNMLECSNFIESSDPAATAHHHHNNHQTRRKKNAATATSAATSSSGWRSGGGGGSGKWRKSFTPVGLELPKLRLPKFTRVSEKSRGKCQTGSLPKMNTSKADGNGDKTGDSGGSNDRDSLCSLNLEQSGENSLQQMAKHEQQRRQLQTKTYHSPPLHSSHSTSKFQYQALHPVPTIQTQTTTLQTHPTTLQVHPPTLPSNQTKPHSNTPQTQPTKPQAYQQSDPPSPVLLHPQSPTFLIPPQQCHSPVSPLSFVTTPSSNSPALSSHQAPNSAPLEVVHNSWSDVTAAGKDPRKDSGIRSRGSSINTQILGGDADVEVAAGAADERNETDSFFGGSFNFSLTPDMNQYHYQMRKQSDLRLIQCVQQEKTTTNTKEYTTPSPYSKISLRFLDAEIEEMYREQAHQPRVDEPKTLASTLYNTYFDILVNVIVHIVIGASLFALYPPTIGYMVLFCLSTLWQLSLLVLCQVQVLRHGGRGEEEVDEGENEFDEQQQLNGRLSTACAVGINSTTLNNKTRRREQQRLLRERSTSWAIYSKLTRWKTWHVCGAILLCLPLACILTNFSCDYISEDNESFRYFCYLSFVAIIHFCNFAQLNCWMKNFLATIGVGILLGLLVTPYCPCSFNMSALNATQDMRSKLTSIESNIENGNLISDGDSHTNISSVLSQLLYDGSHNTGIASDLNTMTGGIKLATCREEKHWFHVEIIVTLVLLLAMVWLLNREFEISYRLSFHGWCQAMQDKIRVQAMKNQVEWMLHNIIPKHVANKIKPTNAKYSENHTRVSIIFASIVNFNEFYDETFCGGKECLRYLNELVGDFDELLSRPQFENVIKIKTIGSTYMAASGLNPDVRRKNPDPDHHIFELVEFAKELQQAISNFNKDLLGLNFILRIGLNIGDVTAGVIGTTKLYYDIWGDAVNIASRMDSTGVKDRIQVNEESVQILRRKYEFEPRGKVYVKGKDNMNVYLLKKTEIEDTTDRMNF